MKGLVLCDGPKRLPFVILLKRRDTSHKARVLDRNQPGDAFGGGLSREASVNEPLGEAGILCNGPRFLPRLAHKSTKAIRV
jgi:hypothetical protein